MTCTNNVNQQVGLFPSANLPPSSPIATKVCSRDTQMTQAWKQPRVNRIKP